LELLEKVATPNQISTLLKLLVYSSPRSKIIVLRILENLTRVHWKPEIFDKGVEIFAKDKESFGYDLMHKINPTWKIDNAPFLTFIHHYLLTIRLKIWAKSSMESQGQYAISCQLIGLLLISYEQSGRIENHPWRQAIDKLLN
jgi:hypothetical protein